MTLVDVGQNDDDLYGMDKMGKKPFVRSFISPASPMAPGATTIPAAVDHPALGNKGGGIPDLLARPTDSSTNLGSVPGSATEHHDDVLGEHSSMVSKPQQQQAVLGLRPDIEKDFDNLRQTRPTREQFKQPPLSKFQKVGGLIAGFGADLAAGLERRPMGQGRQMAESILGRPEAQQEKLYSRAEEEWKDKLGGLEDEVKLGHLQSEAMKNLEGPKPQILENTPVGPISVKPGQTTGEHITVNGQVVGPRLPEQEQPIGKDRATALNADLLQRFQVLHPGQQPPANFALNENSTQKDYDRAMAAMGGIENAEGVKGQRDFQHEQAEAARRDREQKMSEEWVEAQDPTGHWIAGPRSQIEGQMKMQNPLKVEGTEIQKIESARALVGLYSRTLELLDQLDKRGQIGVFQSRYNDFKAGKIGSGDPDFARYRVVSELENSLLSNVHFGSRGAFQLINDFKNLASGGKMDAPTMKAAVEEELRYGMERAKLPGQQGAPQTISNVPGQQGGGEETWTFDPDGNRVKTNAPR